MKHFSIVAAFLVACSAQSQNTVCFDIEANPYQNDPALSLFTKYVDVHGFEILGESGVSDEKVLHAAAVAAELLDNDEDGVVDHPQLHAQLLSVDALMPVFNAEGSPAYNAFSSNYQGEGVSAILSANEVNPTSPGVWPVDATVEEIIHTINHRGHVALYPSVFGIQPNSSLMSAAMDTARGGQWLSIPNPYPAAAWYHYDDVTCDYECMAVEYMYWCIVSNMGLLDETSICNGISNEWEICTAAQLMTIDTAMYSLITNTTYGIPQNAPDGNYCPPGLSVPHRSKTELFKLIENPVSDRIRIELNENLTVELIGASGKMIESRTFSRGIQTLDVSGLASGVYLIRAQGQTERLVIER